MLPLEAIHDIQNKIIELGFTGPYGCACPGNPKKFKKGDDYVLKIYFRLDKWDLWKNNTCVRYGKIESIIEEITDHFSNIDS